ncbi:hypothetical protein [Bordetella genomosp. 7]|uniref:Type IVB pilus formation outer membrane protein, R64 PilN family n=1 Tax=Bordetella genomosp. 7 TaxID=1416805 RepID=A0A261RK57_9BORD|nr:hypothetical protein [Bordetella genomosp. 7]OZI25052.1 hypothetical protein CAL19_06145 [Bordetella genomosp. 7]
MILRFLPCSLALLTLGGCAAQQSLQALRDAIAGAHTQLESGQRQFAAAASDRAARIAAQDVDKPWLAGRPQPLARDAVLPPALRGEIDTTLLFAGKLDLPALAERLTRTTGIAVRVAPDALLPQSLFLPRLGNAVPADLATTLRVPVQAGPRPLPDTLDMLAASFGVNWRYHRHAIEFYRMQTRVFDVRALTLSSRADARLGRSGSAEAGGFDNTSSTALSSGDQHALQAVRARILPFLTQAGTVAELDGGGSTLVITDTPEVLDRIAQFIDGENQALTRRVRLLFEELTVVANDGAEGGVDWKAVYESARTAVTATIPAVAGSTAAALGATVESGGFQRSQAIVSALSQSGAVLRHSSVPVLTLNRRPVTHAVRTTFSYIDQVQSMAVAGVDASLGGVALPSVSISQKQETVGTFLTLVPDAQADGRILLSIAYDNTVAQPIKSVTFGERGNQIQIQQVTIDGNGTVQQVALSPGEPVILSGFDRRQDEYDRRRLTPDAPLLAGGQDRVSRDRLTTIVIVTAMVEEGI